MPVNNPDLQDEPIIQNPWVRWGLIMAAYTGLTVFFFGQYTVSAYTAGRELNLAFRFLNEALYWYLWAAFTPLMLWYAKKFRIGKSSRMYGVVAHIILAVILSPLHDVLWRFLTAWWQRGLSIAESANYISSIGDRVLVGSFTGFYKYWLIIGIYYAFDYYHKYRLREREAAKLAINTAELEAQLRDAELEALRMQLHPHFLFNTLNTISVLMSEDVNRANAMLLRLSDLLRITLEQGGAQVVSLKQEVEFIKSYLDIEQVRFSDRLRVLYQLPPELLDAEVPSLLLQPLVENAIKHGLAPLAEGGRLEISAEKRDSWLILRVVDNGVGIRKDKLDSIMSDGIGLANTAERLRQRYGLDHDFSVVPGETGGVRAEIRIPFNRSGS